MTKAVIATLKGALNSSIDIVVDTMCHVGQKISFEDMGKIVPPQLEDYTSFFYKCASARYSSLRIPVETGTPPGLPCFLRKT